MCLPKKPKALPEKGAAPGLPEKPISTDPLASNANAQDLAMFGAGGKANLRRDDPTVAATILPQDAGLRM